VKKIILGIFLGAYSFGAERNLTYVFDSLSHPEPIFQKRLVCQVFQNKVIVETTLEGVTLTKESPFRMDEASSRNFQELIETIIQMPLVSVPGPEQRFKTKMFVTDPASEEVDTLRETGNLFVASRHTEAFARLGRILIHACHMAGYPGTMNETFASGAN